MKKNLTIDSWYVEIMVMIYLLLNYSYFYNVLISILCCFI